MHIIASLIKQDQENLPNACFGAEMAADRLDCDPRGLVHRVAVCPRADGRKTETPHFVLLRKIETLAVTGRQEFGFAVPSIAIYRSDGVKYVLRGQ